MVTKLKTSYYGVVPMKKLITSILNPNFKYTLEDLDCSLCLYYGGKEDLSCRIVLLRRGNRSSKAQEKEILMPASQSL